MKNLPLSKMKAADCRKELREVHGFDQGNLDMIKTVTQLRGAVRVQRKLAKESVVSAKLTVEQVQKGAKLMKAVDPIKAAFEADAAKKAAKKAPKKAKKAPKKHKLGALKQGDDITWTLSGKRYLGTLSFCDHCEKGCQINAVEMTAGIVPLHFKHVDAPMVLAGYHEPSDQALCYDCFELAEEQAKEAAKEAPKAAPKKKAKKAKKAPKAAPEASEGPAPIFTYWGVLVSKGDHKKGKAYNHSGPRGTEKAMDTWISENDFEGSKWRGFRVGADGVQQHRKEGKWSNAGRCQIRSPKLYHQA